MCGNEACHVQLSGHLTSIHYGQSTDLYRSYLYSSGEKELVTVRRVSQGRSVGGYAHIERYMSRDASASSGGESLQQAAVQLQVTEVHQAGQRAARLTQQEKDLEHPPHQQRCSLLQMMLERR